MIALIPARTGSKRCKGKNTRLLNGHPLIAYTIAAAQQSGIFNEGILVASDDDEALRYAIDSKVRAVTREAVADQQPDIVWIRHVLAAIPRPLTFAILRPTSPFRTAATIRRCYQKFVDMGLCGHSIRAVEPVTQTPYKMWTWDGGGMPIKPLLEGMNPEGVPWHSCPTQTCPRVYVQNSSLEMSWTSNVEVYGTIHGRKVGPFFTDGLEGFSIDSEEDFAKAEQLAREDPSRLPPIGVDA